MERKLHSIKYNFMMNAILSASSFIFPLITFPYLSRILGAEGNGIISFYSSVVSYFLMFASMGIPTYGIRACAQVRNDRKELSKIVCELMAINVVLTIITALVYLFCLLFVERFKEFSLIYLLNGLTLLLNVFGLNWLYQGLEQYDYITTRSLIVKLLCIILMFVLVKKSQDYSKQAAISIIAASGANIFNYIRAHRYVDFKFTISEMNFKRHMKPIAILFAQTLAISVYTNLDLVMLGFLKTNTDVGYYNAAIKIKYILLSVVNSLGQVLLPRMSFYAKAKEEKKFLETMTKSVKFTLLLSIPLAIYFVEYALNAMMLLAGDKYLGAVLAMKIITLSIIPIGLTGVIGTQVLTAIEKEKYVLISVICGAVFDFGLNMLFIPLWGASGAALSTTICECLVLAVQIYFAKNIIFKILKNLKIYKFLIASMSAGVFGFFFRLININGHFWILASSSILFGIIYLVVLIVLKEELTQSILKWLKEKIFAAIK